MLQVWSHLGLWVVFCLWFVYFCLRLFLLYCFFFFFPFPGLLLPPTTPLPSVLGKHNGFRPPSLDSPYD
ncbi:hypothetical protein KUCAC02_015783 [Chaenocephalus aceratus]|uniref:Uncharacterized protein n=1 Tax=Chaenocephalus aceratus TaxID=36190 RepID=A0ACB9Y0U8_CHAAC|nr:hypothetical protein KUCAC02_015783 [Chaenocephalus aceratus]